MKRIAIGLRAHLGWAAAVALGGSARSPEVLDRRRLELKDPAVPESGEPYHAGEGLDLDEAEGVVRRATEAARAATRRSLGDLVDELRGGGYVVTGAGIVLGSGRTPPTLASALSSHARVHTADGEVFRQALLVASEACGLAVTGVREHDLWDHGSAALKLDPEELHRRLGDFGRAVGPPWRQTEKMAALVAWLSLSGASAGSRDRR